MPGSEPTVHGADKSSRESRQTCSTDSAAAGDDFSFLLGIAMFASQDMLNAKDTQTSTRRRGENAEDARSLAQTQHVSCEKSTFASLSNSVQARHRRVLSANGLDDRLL
jgi:hypothetical protein